VNQRQIPRIDEGSLSYEESIGVERSHGFDLQSCRFEFDVIGQILSFNGRRRSYMEFGEPTTEITLTARSMT